MFKNIWNIIFVNTFHTLEKGKKESKQFDKKVLVIFLTVAFSLIFIQYFGDYSFLTSFLKNIHFTFLSDALSTLKENFHNDQLFYLAYWVGVILIFYLIIPTLVIKLIFKDHMSNYGFSASGIFKSYKIYLVFFAIMLPLILLFSCTGSFQHKYPFYDPSGESLWPNFFIWECLYLLQFFSLEFFFRGFLLHGIKKRFGFYSIFIMMLPYMMIHFHKPMPETIGAVFAGIALGTLSLKSRSIWLGVAIHYSVAITMDLAALWQKGFFG